MSLERPYSTVKRIGKGILRALGYGLGGGFLVLLVGIVLHLESRPDLSVWHTARLDAEFTSESPISTFEAYLALEEKLMGQLDSGVYRAIAPEERSPINRFHRGSISDPAHFSRDWNRTFELTTPSPKFGVLLLHGMSDSPYSMRSLGLRLHSEGGWVIGLRLPGHGTAPVGLVDVTWKDMSGAVRLAMEHLKTKVDEDPLFVVGYSNGGALAVEYGLSTLTETSLPAVDGLILLSPEIGVTGLARFAVWQERLGRVLGLAKLSWNSILPEYDPFKYGSFAINAGNQAYRLTVEIQSRITDHEAGVGLTGMPPILAFQSIVDATVLPSSLVQGLFERLPEGGHEMVLFDINRFAGIEPLLKSDPLEPIAAILRKSNPKFDITLMTNEDVETRAVVARLYRTGEKEPTIVPTGHVWPKGLYSLSHVALPFPPDDPLYGGEPVADVEHIRMESMVLRGERGVLQVSPADILRLRWNPFYAYLEGRMVDFVRHHAGEQGPAN
jgi:alpha-beta hydrolase superfamily lysophospholipase